MHVLLAACLTVLPSLTLGCSPGPNFKPMNLQKQWEAAQFVVLGTVLAENNSSTVQLNVSCVFKTPPSINKKTLSTVLTLQGIVNPKSYEADVGLSSCAFTANHNARAVVYLKSTSTDAYALQEVDFQSAINYDVGDLTWVPTKYRQQALGSQCPPRLEAPKCPTGISSLTPMKNLNGLIKDNTTEYLVAGQLSWNETAAIEVGAASGVCKNGDCTLENVFLNVSCVMKTPAGVNASQLIGTMQEIQGFLNPYIVRNAFCDYNVNYYTAVTTRNVVLTLKKTDKGKFVLDKTLTRSAVKVIPTPVPKAKLPGQNWKTITGGEKCKAFVEESVWKRPNGTDDTPGTKNVAIASLSEQFFSWLSLVYLPGESDLPGVPLSAWDFSKWGLSSVGI